MDEIKAKNENPSNSEIAEIREKIKDFNNLDYISKGSFGVVYKLNFNEEKKYAIKTISKDLIKNYGGEDLESYLTSALRNEVIFLKEMSKFPNSVKFYAFFNEKTEYIMVLELCDTDLSKLLEKKGTFSSLEILQILEGLNEPFKYMHKNNIAHRDIKPENIFVKYIDSSKTKFIPKIGDYGITRKLDNGKAQTRLGSKGFMSPEIIDYNEYDDKSDIFSLGVTIYQLHFGTLPFEYQEVNGEIVKYNTKVKEKDCEDKVLDDLINKMLDFNPKERISWDDYFKHPFFNHLNEQLDNMKLYDEKKHQIINVFDIKIETILGIISHFDTTPKVECLKPQNEPFLILGILGKYLEQIGISITIEGQKTLEKSWEIGEYNKSVFQFICNSYILKSKYLLLFNLGEDKLKTLIKNPILKGEFNGKVRKAIMKKYNLEEDEILTSNHRKEKNKFTVMLIIKSNFNINITKDELIKAFSEDEELLTLEKVEKELLFPKIKLNLEMLFPKEDNKNNDWGKPGIRGGEYYNPPIGWIKYGINISHCFNTQNFDWIKKNNEKEWCIAYCGITGLTKTMEQIYENENDTKHQNKKVGVGVYCYSDPKLLEEYTETIDVDGDNYKVGFMVRVKPDKIRVSEKNKNIWVVNGNDNELRPYGILIKKA